MSIGPSEHRPRWLWLLLALALVHGLIYAVVTPPWQAPDETGHFEYSWLIAHQGRLPSKDDLSPALEGQLVASLFESRWDSYFAGPPLPQILPTRLGDLPWGAFAHKSRTALSERFSLAYVWQALFLLPVRGQDLALQLLMARFSSVALNLGIIWLAFLTFCELAPARPKVAFAMALVIVLMPQHTFVNSVVGEGPLAELMASVVLYGWVRLFRRGARPGTFLAIALGTALAVLSKATAFFLIPLDIALGLWWLLRQRRPGWNRRRSAYLGISVAAIGIGAWIWSQTGTGTYHLESFGALVSAPTLMLADRRGVTLDQALLLTNDSFWGVFGWMAVTASLRWYGAALVLMCLAAVGWLGGNEDEQGSPPSSPAMMALAFLFAFAAFLWAGLLANPVSSYQPQGRYLFPAIIPFSYLLVNGWLRLLPARRQNLLYAGVLFLAMFDGWSLLGYIIPFFYYR